MAFVPTYKSRVLARSYSFSCVANQVGVDAMTDMLEVTAMCDTAKQFIVGPNTATVSMAGYLDVDGSADALFDQLNDWKSVAAAEPFTYAPNGTALGGETFMAGVYETQFTAESSQSGVVGFSMAGQADGPFDPGVSIADLAAITVDTSGTSVDNGASTANGGVAHLHVTAFSGLTSDVIIVEHSTNNSVWATLGTFSTVTGLTSQRLVIAPGTTVNRYLRVGDDVTGTGSITRQVSFARR